MGFECRWFRFSLRKRHTEWPATLMNSERQTRSERRLFATTCAVFVVLAFLVYAWVYGSTYVAYWKYTPQEGDILFQSLPHSRLVNAIEGVSECPYSHCGIVSQQDGEWVVFEAYRNVEATPLREFVFRGRQQGFVALRLKSAHQQHVSATIANVKNYLGRPYDARYRMDDERIYCTELIYKAFEQACGQQLGELERLEDLNWKPHEESIRHFEQGPVPLEREMITPKQMALAAQLELVVAHNIAKPQ